MAAIKNIIFDLGGVLMNLDYNRTTDSFKELGFTDFEKMYTQFRANNVFENLETGHINEKDFYNYMLEAHPGAIATEQVTKAWNAMLLDFRAESLDFLKKLRERHKLFLLSNTNSIHKAAFDELFSKQTGIDSIDIFFDKAYYSHHVGMRKPNPDIFEFLLKDAGIDASETFFVDDLFPNIEAAQKLGIKTHLLLPTEKIEDLNYG